MRKLQAVQSGALEENGGGPEPGEQLPQRIRIIDLPTGRMHVANGPVEHNQRVFRDLVPVRSREYLPGNLRQELRTGGMRRDPAQEKNDLLGKPPDIQALRIAVLQASGETPRKEVFHEGTVGKAVIARIVPGKERSGPDLRGRQFHIDQPHRGFPLLQVVFQYLAEQGKVEPVLVPVPKPFGNLLHQHLPPFAGKLQPPVVPVDPCLHVG